MFHVYHAQTTGVPGVGGRPENPRARGAAGDSYRSQLTRGAGHEAGIPGQVPIWVPCSPHGPRSEPTRSRAGCTCIDGGAAS
eukprot:7513627-Pyramimonas_sp.AAC.1